MLGQWLRSFAADRARLEAIVADRNRAQKHVARARIILGSADRLSVAEVARRAGVGRPAVWRWQRRFAEAGVDGLMRATRKRWRVSISWSWYELRPLAKTGSALTITCELNAAGKVRSAGFAKTAPAAAIRDEGAVEEVLHANEDPRGSNRKAKGPPEGRPPTAADTPAVF
jgi:hypothetical protein